MKGKYAYEGLFGARAAVACVLAVAVVLVALAQADRAKATVPGGDSSTSKHKGHKGGLVDPALEESLEAAFEKSFQDSGAPGAIAAVRTPDGTWDRSLGVANKASGQPMQADMHHRIGSVSKTFTATLLLQAAVRGQISLDDTIDRYVEGIPNGDEITLRQMADMSSGIASYTENEQFQEDLFADPEAIWTPEELARIGIKDSPLFDPGKGWHYSNTNYVLLGMVLEQVTGKPIERLYSKQIIKPLHLKETSFPNAADSSIPEPCDHGYTLQGQSDGEPVDATDWNPSSSWTAGGMISTVDDMLVYGRALGTGKGLLPREQQAERFTSFLYGLPPHSPEKAYGLGLVTVGGWLGHTGTQPGFNTTVYYHPQLHNTVVVEINSDISAGRKTSADLMFGTLAAEVGKPSGTD